MNMENAKFQPLVHVLRCLSQGASHFLSVDEAKAYEVTSMLVWLSDGSECVGGEPEEAGGES